MGFSLVILRRARALAAAAAAAAGVAGACRRDAAPAPSPPPPRAPALPAPPGSPGSRVFPVEMAPVLDDPGRDAWQRPDEVVAALAIRPGERIADVGCGTGYFTVRLLRAAGESGHVLAVDVQQGMLDILARRLTPAERARVTLRRNAPDRPLEPSDAVDLAFCANTLYEVDEADAARFVRSMAGGLVPGGRLAVLDWKEAPGGPARLGPPPEVRLSAVRIADLARGAGLAPAREIDLLPTHTFLVFTKPR